MIRTVISIYRFRAALISVATVVLLANVILAPRLGDGAARSAWLILVYLALGCFLLGGVFVLLGARYLPTTPPAVVAAPVTGRWRALNSPASRVPSHGIRMYGQAYAIDLVHEPHANTRPAFGGRMMRPNAEYPAFGQPVSAMVDGTVVRAVGHRRDHRARSNLLGIAYMLLEGMIREFGGPGFILGNHVTIEGRDSSFALVAHLQQGSLTVVAGDQVRAGEVIGRCGNSGNSSEPHVHAQLMDRISPWTAQGLPLAFTDITLGNDATPATGVPANDELMNVGA